MYAVSYGYSTSIYVQKGSVCYYLVNYIQVLTMCRLGFLHSYICSRRQVLFSEDHYEELPTSLENPD